MRLLPAVLAILLLGSFPALAQPVMPPNSSPADSAQAARSDAAVAHHERVVAHRAAMHGRPRKAAAAAHAARAAGNAAAVNSANAGMTPR